MFWQRPLPELPSYRGPIAGLYLGGAGQHLYGEVKDYLATTPLYAILEDLSVVERGCWKQR